MQQHVLICISDPASGQKALRAAANLAKSLDAKFTALCVEPSTKAKREVSPQDRKELAAALGAQIETVYGDDLGFQISEFAATMSITHVVVGKCSHPLPLPFKEPELAERLAQLLPGIEIYQIPVGGCSWHEREMKRRSHNRGLKLKDCLILVGGLAAATLAGFCFDMLGLGKTDIVPVYILSALLIAVFTDGFLCSAISSFLAVLLFDFFFVEPKFTLVSYDLYGVATSVIVFLCSLGMGLLAAKLRLQEYEAAQSACRTKVLLEISHSLQLAESRQEIAKAAATQIIKLLGKTVVIYDVKNEELETPELFFGNDFTRVDKDRFLTAKEHEAALQVLKTRKRAGAGTEIVPDAECLYLAARGGRGISAVAGIAMKNDKMNLFENNLVMSVLDECALSLEYLDSRQERLF